jgi:hypothetical protein
LPIHWPFSFDVSKIFDINKILTFIFSLDQVNCKLFSDYQLSGEDKYLTQKGAIEQLPLFILVENPLIDH